MGYIVGHVYKVTTQGLRYRSEVSLDNSTVLGYFNLGDTFKALNIWYGTRYTWLQLDISGRKVWTAAQNRAGTEIYVTEISTNNRKYGVHVLNTATDTDRAILLQMANAGVLSTVVVVDRGEICNELANAGVPTVIYRKYLNDSQNFPDIYGSTDDIQRGINFYDSMLASYTPYLHPNVYIQGQNEQNHPNDGYWYDGVRIGAEKQNRKIVAFNDSVGSFDMNEVSPGKYFSQTWDNRYRSGVLKALKDGGHLVGYHGYGDKRGGPASEIWPNGYRDDSAWPWFGGRACMIYDTQLPADHKPNMVLTETFLLNANAQAYGQDWTISEFLTLNQRLQAYPYVIGFAGWTAGTWNVNAQSSFSEYLPAIYDTLRLRG